MNEPTPDRPTRADDLDEAYARSHAFADDGRGPAASVRANVLAAAQAAVAEAVARRATEAGAPPPLAPVAAPVAAVGRGRPRAVNLSSWRVRAGAAFCVAALAAAGGWRFEASRRDDGAVQVASAGKAVEPQREAAAPPLPPPPAAALATAAPPAADRTPTADAKTVARDKDVVVAQADRPHRSQDELRSRQAGREALREAAPPDAARRAAAAPTVVAAAAPPAPAPAEAPAPAPAPVVVAQAPVQAPAAALDSAASPPAPRVALAAAPAPSALDDKVATAAAEAEPVARATAGRRAGAVANAKKASPAMAGALASASLRVTSAPLQSAADRGDVEALETLLADPATRVDAPDADGRTALLHAVLAQRPAAVRLLLAAGADPGRADRAGLTPRQAARTGASAEIAALLAAPR